MNTGFKIDYAVTASARNIKAKYPIGELKPSKVVGGKLVGPSFIIKGKKTTDVSHDVYKSAREQKARVTPRQFKDGVRVFRVS